MCKEGECMENYKASRGKGIYYILGSLFVYDALIIILLFLINSYIMSSLFKILLIGGSIYHIYYLFLISNLEYIADEEDILIYGALGLKKVHIPIKDIIGYSTSSEYLKCVRLSGFGRSTFALGRFIFSKIGASETYITSNNNVIFIKTNDGCYAISPKNVEGFEKFLTSKGVMEKELDKNKDSSVNLHKDKSFIHTLIAVSVVIFILTLTPFVLYITGRLPSQMPLNFDASFLPVQYGTGKQFAISQAIYGVLNMAVLFCMYYASYFYAKYDKKSANKFLYISLIISLAFLLVQFRILFTFR